MTTRIETARRNVPLVAFTITNSAAGPGTEELKVVFEVTVEPPINAIFLGAKDTETSEISGGLEDVRVTGPENPFMLVSVILDVLDTPGSIDTIEGKADMMKSDADVDGITLTYT
jgi:hypothetical protein